MERRFSKCTILLAALFAWAAEISCGAGIHDAAEEQSTTKLVTRGSRIEFMGARLDICDTCLSSDTEIKLTWSRSIPHAGALGGVYSVEVPARGTFTNDPKITIATTPEIANAATSQIGFLENGQWIPDRPSAMATCDFSTVCGPVQIGSYKTTNVLQFAIVTMCGAGYATSCPAMQSCASSGACQQCPDGSPCS